MIELLKDIETEMTNHSVPFFVDYAENDILICNFDSGKFAALQVRNEGLSLLSYSPAIEDMKVFITAPVVPGMQTPEFVKEFVGKVIDFMSISDL